MSTDADLHREFGELKGTVSALTERVKDLTVKVEELTNALNQAKGAKYALFLLPAIVGGIGGILGFLGLKATIGH